VCTLLLAVCTLLMSVCTLLMCLTCACRGFASQLPEAFPVALSVLQEAAGSVLLPWLATQPALDEEACEVSIEGSFPWHEHLVSLQSSPYVRPSRFVCTFVWVTHCICCLHGSHTQLVFITV
jgi:hypothetical protein